MAAEVNWSKYFEDIRDVCPWSYSAWRKGLINLVEWQGYAYPLGSWKARVYLTNLTPKQLERIHNKLNDEYDEYEFLWSHPNFVGNSTPTPCIIQQSASELESIRNGKISRISM